MTAPDKLVQDTSDQVIQNLRKQSNIANNLSAAYQIIDQYVAPNVDDLGMARSVLGRDRWMAATPAQQARFTQAFKVLVMRTYAAALSQYTNERVRVLPFHASPADDRVLVQTQILGDGPPLSVNYRLVRLNNTWKMYDFDVEGVSMLRSFRSQFNETLANNHNNIDALITDIEQHNLGKS
jgi:phospholipid transport system substrate-binding protein